MLRGIDISNHQGDDGLNIECLLRIGKPDFVIVKATGGDSFVDPYCDIWVKSLENAGILWGFYHLAGDCGFKSAASEARHFIDSCSGYFGKGIPILDWEVDACYPTWINAFVSQVENETGIWPWIYGNAWRFTKEINRECARWVTAYPSHLLYPDYREPNIGNPPECPGTTCAWQFASDARIDGYNGDVDANVFYGNKENWLMYANPKYQPDIKPVNPVEVTLKNRYYAVRLKDTGKGPDTVTLNGKKYEVTIRRK